MGSPSNTLYTTMDSPPSTPLCTDGQPSKYAQYANGQLSEYAYTPMDSPPARTHKMNADLDLSAVLNPTENYSSPLPLSVGRSFYRKCGNLYQKNSGTQRKYHEQTRINQLSEFRQSNVAGILQENVSSLKKKLRFSNLQILPFQRGTIAVAEHILKHGPLVPNTVLSTAYKNASRTLSEIYINGQAFMSQNTLSNFQARVISQQPKPKSKAV